MMKSFQAAAHEAQRLGVAEAKAKLSEVLRQAEKGPTIIHSRGRDVAVVLAIEEYERLAAGQQSGAGGGGAFLRRVEAVKLRHGGGVDFEPPRLDLAPWDPFARKSKGRA